ncbi:MAG: hypothetical protein M3Z04_07515 [Chloroflexota bacterium]|nr:hypothetical protein [Chloroflexota bacterium]
MSTTDQSYDTILQIVTHWPPAQRFDLVQEVLKTLAPAPEATRPRQKTLATALGMLAKDQPPPSDAEVEQWLEEARMEKYG